MSVSVVGATGHAAGAAIADVRSLPTNAGPAQTGQWSAPFDMGVVAIHATLTYNGDVLLFQYVEGKAGVDHTSLAGTWNYLTGTLQGTPLSYARDIFCGGTNVLPEGQVFIAGGHNFTTGKKQDAVGVDETDTYDPATRTFAPAPRLGEKRWYPTNVGLPSGKTLVFGGSSIGGTPSMTVDEYNPVTGTMRRLPSTATKKVGLYPRMNVMSNGRLLKSGPAAMATSFNPATNSWSNVGAMLFGPRTRGNSILLAGSQRVLAVGGQSSASSPVTGTTEILDMTAATPRWRSTGSLNYPRQLSSSVLLPDGQVLTIGGGAKFKYTGPVKIPELYNPATETWTALAPQQASRMYHSTALLLPDGRVLSAGQDNGPLATHGEIFSPPYLFNGPRPRITSASTSVNYGQSVSISSPDAANIASVTLMKAGSMTHEIDSDQRGVPLTFTASGTTITAQAPASANLAPPGYYMLFILNADGVPSVAPWIQVG